MGALTVNSTAASKAPTSGVPAVTPEQLLPMDVRVALAEEARSVLSRINDPSTRKEILAVGTKMRGAADRTGNLLKARFKDVVAENPNRQELEANMDSMQDAIAELDPLKAGRLNPIISLFTRNKIAAQLRRLSRSYETSEKKIEIIEKALKDSSSKLEGDSNDLLGLYNGLQEQQREIARRVVVMDSIMAGLEEKREDASYEPDRMFEHQLINNLGDLKISMVVFQQFMESIDMTVNNNNLLSQQVHRVSNLVANMARAGLAIQQALLNQKKTSEFVGKVRDSMQTMMESNAKMIGQNTMAIAEAASTPIISLEALKSSYQELQRNKQALEDLRERTLLESRQALDSIEAVTSDMRALPGISSAAPSARSSQVLLDAVGQ